MPPYVDDAHPTTYGTCVSTCLHTQVGTRIHTHVGTHIYTHVFPSNILCYRSLDLFLDMCFDMLIGRCNRSPCQTSGGRYVASHSGGHAFRHVIRPAVKHVSGMRSSMCFDECAGRCVNLHAQQRVCALTNASMRHRQKKAMCARVVAFFQQWASVLTSTHIGNMYVDMCVEM